MPSGVTNSTTDLLGSLRNLGGTTSSAPPSGNRKRSPWVYGIVVLVVLGVIAAAGGVAYHVATNPDADSDDQATGTAAGSSSETLMDSDATSQVTETSSARSPTQMSPSRALSPGSGDSAAEAPGPGDAGVMAPVPAPAPAPAAYVPPVAVNSSLGKFEEVTEMPVIPVATAVLPSGKVVSWSSSSIDGYTPGRVRFDIGGGGLGQTLLAIYDSETGTVTDAKVSHTKHDMFCPGLTYLPNGDLMVTGGQHANKTSFYHVASEEWSSGPDMAISRGYGSSVLLSNNRVMVFGGSWSGPRTIKKDAEIYDLKTETWSMLPEVKTTYIETDDPQGPYRSDNYPWLFAWSNGTAFHAGPRTQMHWIHTDGDGRVVEVNKRPGIDSMNGAAVMYDAGKILTLGGALSFSIDEYPALPQASRVTITKPDVPPEVVKLNPMHEARTYVNAVVLPDGKVFVHGGAHRPKEFSDEYAVLSSEIWDPETDEFVLMDDKPKIPRTYHSTAALLPSGKVFTGGGGLCGKNCKMPGVNHLDFEIFSPPYLFNANGTEATRPIITVSTKSASHGMPIDVHSSEPLMMVSMIRHGAVTHSTNLDQRRIELCGPYTTPCGDSPVRTKISDDPGIAIAGPWMVFGINHAGVPSEAWPLLVGLVE